jgi:hypothetical protein
MRAVVEADGGGEERPPKRVKTTTGEGRREGRGRRSWRRYKEVGARRHG